MSDPLRSSPLARSFLYVPADQPALFDKASRGPADAIILDLEDAVPLPAKDEARTALSAWLSEPSAPSAAETWVRVDPENASADLEAAVHPGLSGIFVAKCTAETVREIGDQLSERERRLGLAAGRIRMIGLIESAAALRDLTTIAQSPRVTTFAVGEVDLLADLRIERRPDTAPVIDGLRTSIVVACAAAGLTAPVAPTSTDYRDLDTFRATTHALSGIGFRSRTAIHPAQVPVIHDVLTPSPEAVESARAVVDRFERASGGVTTDDRGRLIDAAVVRGAREILARSARATSH
ncbi:CoA ester lyase [Aeromicrobium sp. YIM 150415]|uniref:HpcH/HpaI aldolase/citrate lyase family protein n=1 Tax=Aeromicrobium sp. YIM 150415 TaxID=2803912 RepID=UPI001964C049|nr:CoA ester lyase [Aeromicrobium sp. YIM 150415]MBM9465231.1 CoA ester lyase [Aeromicrobium sp. YIM 150415]